MISSTSVDETFITRFMHISPPRNVDTGLAVVVRLKSPLLLNQVTPKAQTEKVLNHAREELMKEFRELSHSCLLVEG
jgi:hypothetical protein